MIISLQQRLIDRYLKEVKNSVHSWKVSLCHFSLRLNSAFLVILLIPIWAQRVVEDLGITKSSIFIPFFCFAICFFLYQFAFTVKTVFKCKLGALNQLSRCCFVCWNNLLTLYNFAERNSVLGFKQLQVSNLLINCWVVNQRQSLLIGLIILLSFTI